mgnify:CR=1 FL=1
MFEAEEFGPGIRQARIYEGIVIWNQREMGLANELFTEQGDRIKAFSTA